MALGVIHYFFRLWRKTDRRRLSGVGWRFRTYFYLVDVPARIFRFLSHIPSGHIAARGALLVLYILFDGC